MSGSAGWAGSGWWRSTFRGFRSQWWMPRRWTAASASATRVNSRTASAAGTTGCGRFGGETAAAAAFASFTRSASDPALASGMT
ncbi:hypothetical protein J0H58_28160 [bacterium]|nr:hypothetical protein [bacterium]